MGRNFQGSSLPEGISKLTNLDEQSMRGILVVCKSMTKLPEDLFEHPYFRALTSGTSASGRCSPSLQASGS